MSDVLNDLEALLVTGPPPAWLPQEGFPLPVPWFACPDGMDDVDEEEAIDYCIAAGTPPAWTEWLTAHDWQNYKICCVFSANMAEAYLEEIVGSPVRTCCWREQPGGVIPGQGQLASRYYPKTCGTQNQWDVSAWQAWRSA